MCEGPCRGRWSTVRYILLALVFLPIVSSCGRWYLGTWVPITPGWSGILLVQRDREASPFRLSLTGHDRSLAWEGIAKPVDGFLRLDVFRADGSSLYPESHFSRDLRREGGVLILWVGETQVRFQKQ